MVEQAGHLRNAPYVVASERDDAAAAAVKKTLAIGVLNGVALGAQMRLVGRGHLVRVCRFDCVWLGCSGLCGALFRLVSLTLRVQTACRFM